MILTKKLLTLVVGFIIIDLLISTTLSSLSDKSLIRYSRLYNIPLGLANQPTN
jgi:hypothetical protein